MLQGHALVSMPQLRDRNFYKTVVHICHHTTGGAFGFVTNRKMDMHVAQGIAEHLGIGLDYLDKIYWGGPCSVDTVMILHSPEYEIASTRPITDWLSLTRDRKIIRDIIAGLGPHEFKIILGHSAWGPGQLEHVMQVQKTWTSFPSDLEWALSDHLVWEDALAYAGQAQTTALLDSVFESQ